MTLQYSGPSYNPVQGMDALLTAASGGGGGGHPPLNRTLVSRDKVNLSSITNNEDRQFVEEVMDELLGLEPGNDLVVEFFNNGPLWLMTVQGMKNPIDDVLHQRFRAKRHPIMGHVAIVKTQVVPPKGLDPLKFAVHIVPSGPKLAQQQQIAHQQHIPPPLGAPPPQYYPPQAGLVPLGHQEHFQHPGPPNYGQTMVKQSHRRRAKKTRDASPSRGSSSSSSESSSSSDSSSEDAGQSVLAALNPLNLLGRNSSPPRRRNTRRSGRK